MPTNSDKKEEILKELLKNNPSRGAVELDLPSKGRFYIKDEPDKPITLSPLTWEDEKSLASSQGSNPSMTLMNRCLHNVNAESLLDCDRSYILIKLREISLGPDYEAKVTCPACGKIGEIGIDTRDFRTIEIPDDVTNPRQVTLPVCKVDVEVRFPTAKEDNITQDPAKFIDNIWRFVTSVGGHTDPEIIASFVKELTLRDSQFLRNKITGDYGVDTQFIYACGECGKENLMGVPIGSDFFLST